MNRSLNLLCRTLGLALGLMAGAVVLTGCATPTPAAAPLKDGELALPAGYKTWPRFLSTIDRPDVKQVREIFLNPTAARIRPGEAFAQGSRFVMEIYAAATQPDGTPRMEAGRLVKGNLLHVYVMGKEEGWGGDVVEALRTGNWIYAAYKPDGTANTPLVTTCRGCHVPYRKDDFVIHLDRYFAERKAALDAVTDRTAQAPFQPEAVGRLAHLMRAAHGD